MKRHRLALTPQQLHASGPALAPTLPAKPIIYGQPRGVEALEFGFSMPPDYHIFVAGAEGTGRLSAIQQAIPNLPTPAPLYLYPDATKPQWGRVTQDSLPDDIDPETTTQLNSDYVPVHIMVQPTLDKLLGYFAYTPHPEHPTYGYTNFAQVVGGALVNSGVLVIDADQLEDDLLWELLLILKERQYTLDTLREGHPAQFPVWKTAPIPVTARVILVGSIGLFENLYYQFDIFREVFRVRAEFVSEMPRNPETEQHYASFLAQQATTHQLPAPDESASATLIEIGSRWAGDQCKLSTRFGALSALLREAGAYANGTLTGDAIHQALAGRVFRANEGEVFERERILNGELFLDTSGKIVGQINGLFIISAGDYRYGLPSRITATVYMGGGGITQIDRSSDLTGNIHDKGLMILESYLNATFGQQYGLNFGASLLFDQNYSDIDGDSASVAELFALLSALGNLPLRQDLAVTGSMNQRGDVQPIGDATHKIEGFFKLCEAQGLTGKQGVIIPQTNIRELMLSQDVIEAVEAGQFHVYAIRHVDEGIRLLTGKSLTTIHDLVDNRLRELSEKDDDEKDEKSESSDEDSVSESTSPIA